MSFIRTGRPSLASKAFFAFVDSVLCDLADRRAWEFEEKPTCCRLVISDNAHLDVPLYAIPDKEFVTLQKAARAAAMESVHGSVNLTEAKRQPSRDRWDLLPHNEVLLAVRGEDWKESDPRLIDDWFSALVEQRHGEQLRRVCRYLKGWRDYHHETVGNVTSILLMACAARVYDDAFDSNEAMPERDDLALLAVLRRLPKLLEGPVPNPATPEKNEDLSAKLDATNSRKKAVLKVKSFLNDLDATINQCYDRHLAVTNMQAIFGGRVPSRPDLVGAVEEARAKVMAYPAAATPAPAVGRSISG